MFTDGRSKKVIFLAHCLLNQNAISDGTAVCPAAFGELIQLLLDREVGIVQMPCPELCCLGLDRGDVHGAERPVVEENTRIRRAMEKDGPRQKREALADLVAEQVQEYHKHGFQVLGIVGAIAQRLEAAGISVPMLGLKGSDDAAQKVAALL